MDEEVDLWGKKQMLRGGAGSGRWKWVQYLATELSGLRLPKGFPHITLTWQKIFIALFSQVSYLMSLPQEDFLWYTQLNYLLFLLSPRRPFPFKEEYVILYLLCDNLFNVCFPSYKASSLRAVTTIEPWTMWGFGVPTPHIQKSVYC